MKVKTFHVGLVNGLSHALEVLDDKVNKQLGDMVIHSVNDTSHCDPPYGVCVVRTVVFSPKK